MYLNKQHFLHKLVLLLNPFCRISVSIQFKIFDDLFFLNDAKYLY